MKIYSYKLFSLPDTSEQIKKLDGAIGKRDHILVFSASDFVLSIRWLRFETYYYLIPLEQDSWIFLAASYLNRVPSRSCKRWNAAVGTADEIGQLAACRFSRRHQELVMLRKKLPESMPKLIACMLAQELER